MYIYQHIAVSISFSKLRHSAERQKIDRVSRNCFRQRIFYKIALHNNLPESRFVFLASFQNISAYFAALPLIIT